MMNSDENRPATLGCDGEFEELLNLYIDGELSFAEQPPLFAHLASCACCRRTLEAVLSFRRISRQESFVVPPAVDDDFFKRLDQHKRRNNSIDRRADRRPLWQARTPVSLRAAATIAGILFLAGLMVPVNAGERVAPSFVEGIDEHVEFPDPALLLREPVYVFYPGLTVEATKLGP